MLPRLVFILAWLALAAGLVLPTINPGVGNVTILVLMVGGLGVLALVPTTRAVLRQPAIAVVLLAGLVLLVALLPTARSPMHIASILILAPLWFAGALAALLTRLGRWLTPVVIGGCALAGTLAGAGVAAYDVVFLGAARGGQMVNNPIHHADLLLMLGFLALVGLLDRRPVRWLFLLGPVLAFIGLWYTASRGPQLAFLPMLAVGGVGISMMLLARKHALVVIGAGAMLLCGAGVLFLSSGMAGRLATIDVSTILQSGTSADGSIGERLLMYLAAWRALLASPFYGHGLVDFAILAWQYTPESPYAASQHLHSDLADFAVIGGALGLLSYGLLLAAPVLGGLATRGPHRQAAIYLGVVTPTGYFAMGLTNAMFGVLAQTMLYGVILALIAALAVNGREQTS